MTELPSVARPDEASGRAPVPPAVGWRQLRWARWFPSLAALLVVLASWGLLSGLLAHLSYIFQPVFVPLLISGALAYLIKPLADWLDHVGKRWVRSAGVRHTLAVLTAMLVAVMGLVLALFVVIPSLAAQLTQAAKKLPAGYQRFMAMAQPVLEGLQQRYPRQYEQVVGGLRERIADPASLVEPVLVGLSTTFSNVIGVVTSLVNLLLIPFFCVLHPEGCRSSGAPPADSGASAPPGNGQRCIDQG